MNQQDSKNAEKFITIANELNKLFGEHEISDKISMPRIVVVGAQSTGKSSLLNKIMKVDILPMGKSMITKTPIHINMHRSDQYMVEIGYYIGDKWNSSHRLIFEDFTEIHMETIRSRIQSLSDNFTDNKPIVVNKPIVINLYSPDVTELSLIDLPGLITIASTDRGQPTNIVDDIQNLVKSYVRQPKTIVLTLIQAKQDLETDLGLALVKHTIDKSKDIHTVGVLTKPDLIDKETHMGDFLLGKMSTSLHMDYGYYIVNCKDNEKTYFNNHRIYNKTEYRKKCGVDNLTNEISDILLTSIKKTLPNIVNDLDKLENETKQKLVNIGAKYLSDDNLKLNYIGITIKEIVDKIINCIESNGSEPNIGNSIDHSYNKFRKIIDDSEIFDSQSLPNAYIRQIYNNHKGYHIKIKATPLEILESLLNQDKKPLDIIRGHCHYLTNLIQTHLSKGIEQICGNENIKFTKFNNKICDLIDKYLTKQKTKAIETLDVLIDSEESYIWTEDANFLETLDSFDVVHKTTSEFDIYQTQYEYENYETKIRRLLNIYLDSLKKTIKNTIPKILTRYFIKECKMNLHKYLFNELNKKESCNLIEFDQEQKHEIDKLNKILTAINTSRNIIS